MKHERTWKTVVAVCALMLVFVLPAHAQTQGSKNFQNQGTGGITALSLDQGLLEKSVQNMNGQNIGEIDDVIFSRRGRMAHYLVNVGGFLGAGDKTVSLNPDQIRVTGQDRIIFNGTRADLENMPEVNRNVWGYYSGYNALGAYGYGPQGGGMYARPYYGRGYMSGPYGGQMGQYQQGQTGGTMRGISGNTLLGAQVLNPQNNQIGEIDDLVVNTRTGRITYAGIGFGGFLDIGEKHVLVPFNQLRVLEPTAVMYQGNENQLGQMPQYQVADNGQVDTQTQRAGGGAQRGGQQQGSQQQSGGGQAQGRQGNFPQQ